MIYPEAVEKPQILTYEQSECNRRWIVDTREKWYISVDHWNQIHPNICQLIQNIRQRHVIGLSGTIVKGPQLWPSTAKSERQSKPAMFNQPWDPTGLLCPSWQLRHEIWALMCAQPSSSILTLDNTSDVPSASLESGYLEAGCACHSGNIAAFVVRTVSKMLIRLYSISSQTLLTFSTG